MSTEDFKLLDEFIIEGKEFQQKLTQRDNKEVWTSETKQNLQAWRINVERWLYLNYEEDKCYKSFCSCMANAYGSGWWSDFDKGLMILESIRLMPNNMELSVKQAEKTPKVFISHNTEDSKYAEAIINLLIALGVQHKEIFCSSVPGYGIPFGCNILDSLHNQFDEFKLFVIFIHSPRYYQSKISLNEMGAAWILRSKHMSFLTSDCEKDMLKGVINSTEIYFKAAQQNTEHLLHDFRKDIVDFFNLEAIGDAIWEKTKNQFIQQTSAIKYEASEEIQNPPKSIENISLNIYSNNSSGEIILDYIKRQKQRGKNCRLNEISAYTKLSVNTTQRILNQLIAAEEVTQVAYREYTTK